jgi:hypothetical protein
MAGTCNTYGGNWNEKAYKVLVRKLEGLRPEKDMLYGLDRTVSG